MIYVSVKFNNTQENACSGLKFGEYLRNLRQSKNISIRQLAKLVNKTPTYLSDIENGYNKPPDKILLDAIIVALGVESISETRNSLYNLAAKERNDIPADIKDYLCGNDTVLLLIRKMKENSINDTMIMQLDRVLNGRED